MANPEHLKILKRGVQAWNEWRQENPNLYPSLSQTSLKRANLEWAQFRKTDLRMANLVGANLKRANLCEANLQEADLREANLLQADVRDARLWRANLWGADLRHADLSRANFQKAYLGETKLQESILFGVNLKEASLARADLRGATLVSANLQEANLDGVNLEGAGLDEAQFHGVKLSGTILSNVNLRSVKGLDQCRFSGPCTIDHRTLEQSGTLPLTFVRGCGLPDNLIEYLPSLLSKSPIQFYSCFISHSTNDQEFADRLYNDLQGNGVRCWYAPEEMKGGEKLYDQIDNAIRVHDKLLLVLSENSLNSEWVRTEMRRCRKAEKKDGTRKLFPLRLVNMEILQNWECFDADYGKDLAVEVREYFIPDFSNWKAHDAYKQAFDSLLRDLQHSGQ